MNKFANYNDSLHSLDLDIKSEVNIKNERLEYVDKQLCNEKDLNCDSVQKQQQGHSVQYQEKTSRTCNEIAIPQKPICSVFIKIEDEVSEGKTEVYEGDISHNAQKEQTKHQVTEEYNFENKFVDIEKDFIERRERNFEVSSSSNSSRYEIRDLSNTGIRDTTSEEKEGDLIGIAFCQQELNTKKVLICSICEYQTNLKGNFKAHLLTHSSSKLFKCRECDYRCNEKGKLKRHALTHSNAKLFNCCECDYGSSNKSLFKCHLLTHSNTKLFKCSECDYECNRKSSLRRHFLTHSNTKLFKCSKCDYECNYRESLKAHLLTHTNTKLFKCSKCDYECNYRESLKIHLLTHTNIKLYKCSECDYECNNKGHLKCHLLIHSNTKMFKCSECDYKCNHKGSLKRHLLTHSKRKLFKCSKCDYECHQKNNLKLHFLTHSKMKGLKRVGEQLLKVASEYRVEDQVHLPPSQRPVKWHIPQQSTKL